MIWSAIATTVIGGIIGGVGDNRAARQQRRGNLESIREENRGALERQNDQQEFEEYLLNRRNVAGGPAYGGPAGETPNFWFGLEDVAAGSGIEEFMAPLAARNSNVTQSSRTPLNTMAYGDETRLDPNTALSYESREEFQNPLYNLRRFLGQNEEPDAPDQYANPLIRPPGG